MAIGPVSIEYINNESAVTVAREISAGENSGFAEVLSKTSVKTGSVDLDAIFEAAALRYNVSPNLLKAIAKVESDFRPDATSKAGAMGIMQLMPGTARGLGVTDAYDPEQNIMGGAKYIRQALDQFDGDVQLALAAYNAGPNNVEKYGGIPPFNETQNYVRVVLEYLGGGDITAGIAAASGGPEETKATTAASSGPLFSMKDFAQMLLFKIIEMQMDSSDNDKRKVF